MSLTYTTFVSSIANLIPTNATSDINFVAMVPNMIDDAEQRLYRELDLLNTSVTDSSSNFTTNTRDFTLPTAQGVFVVTDRINVITPAGATPNTPGATRNPLTPTSRDHLDFTYPSSAGSTVPTYFAMSTQAKIVVGPWPDQSYNVEVTGTQRPLPLSATNITTFLSTYLPDCLIAAGMVFVSAYMKNFGAAVDDPKSGVTWESHLQELIRSAHTEEMRKKFTSQGWSGKEPAPLATPPRS